MSEHDRGAYTPHHDGPLSFDARQSRGRRAFPTTLLISLMILIGLTLAIIMFYRSGVRGAGEAPVPVGTPVGEIKSPPSAQAQQPPQDAGQGLQIYKSESGAQPASGSAPATFGPPPEQPAARPTAPVSAQPIAPATSQPAPAPVAAAPAPQPKPAPAQAVAAAPVKPVPAQPAPKAAATPAKPQTKDEVGALLDKADAAKKPAPQAPAPKAAAAPVRLEPTAGHGAAVVQFGAFSSAALASSEWTKLAAAYPTEMSGKGKLVESVERDGKTLFRGAVSGFASKADAVAFCAKMKADSKACIVR
jgi:outer membrane biosynthesis protein TonB